MLRLETQFPNTLRFKVILFHLRLHILSQIFNIHLPVHRMKNLVKSITMENAMFVSKYIAWRSCPIILRITRPNQWDVVSITSGSLVILGVESLCL